MFSNRRNVIKKEIVATLDICETYASKIPHKFNVITNILTNNISFEIINTIDNKIHHFSNYERALIFWESLYERTHNKAALNKKLNNVDSMSFVGVDDVLVCVHVCDNLILNKEYCVLGFEDDGVYVLNELGEECFYLLEHFDVKPMTIECFLGHKLKMQTSLVGRFKKNYFHKTSNKYLVPVEIAVAFSNINIEKTLSCIDSLEDPKFHIDFLCYVNHNGKSTFKSHIINGKPYTHVILKRVESAL